MERVRRLLEGRVRLAVPNKGRIREPVLRLLSAAGFGPQYTPDDNRFLVSPSDRDDVVIVFLRHEDIPYVVESGAVDLGVAGHDYIVESGARVRELLDLGVAKSKLVLAVPETMGVRSLEELPKGVRVATKFVNIARRFLEEHGVEAEIVKVSGSTEVMPALGVADAVLDVVSTGTTLRSHGLVPIATVMESSARLIAAEEFEAQGAAEEVVEALRSVVAARRMKLVLMNVPAGCLESVLSVLPAMSGPTLAKVEAGEPMWEVMVAVPEDELSRVVLEAKKRGARDILVLNVERVVP